VPDQLMKTFIQAPYRSQLTVPCRERSWAGRVPACRSNQPQRRIGRLA